MKEQFLAKIVRYLVYVIAFVPLVIFSDFISPFHFGKVIIFRSLVYVLGAFYLLLILRDRTYFPKMTKISWAFLLFAVAFSITTATSVIPYSSFWGSLERMGGLFTFWHYFIYFVILTAVFKTEKEWISLFNLMIFVGIISALYGFGQRTDIQFFVGSGGRTRIFGTIGNAALFAGYQIVILFLSFTLLFKSDSSQRMRLYYAFAVVILLIASFMTAVRGSILGIGFGFLLFPLLYAGAYRSKKAKNIFIGLIATLLILVTFILIFRDDVIKKSGYISRITDFSLKSYTVQTRFWAWQAGFNGWKETPKTILLGWGPENFNIPFSKHFNPKFFAGPGSETLFDRAHNMFVEILVTMGLLGIVSYLWIFISSFRILWRKIHNKEAVLYGVGLTSLLAAYIIHNSFIFDTSANLLVFFTILGFISFLSFPKQAGDVKFSRRSRMSGGVLSLVAVSLAILIMVGIYFINILPVRANYATTRAIVTGWAGDFNGAVAKYDRALKYDVPGKYEIRHRFAQYVIEKAHSAKLTPEYVSAINRAIEETKKNVEENKIDYLPYLYLSRLYIILGKDDPLSEYNDLALESALAALDLAPDFVRTHYEIGQVYLNKKDFDNAAVYFKRASELNPEVALSRWYWGIVEIDRGNTELGLIIIEPLIESEVYIPAENNIGRLINVYLKKGDLGKIVWIYEVVVKFWPDNPQYRASLAGAYARVGKIDEAVIQARRTVELDPSYESEASSFVKSLGREW